MDPDVGGCQQQSVANPLLSTLFILFSSRYLADFYNNMQRYAFELQIWLLTKRVAQIQAIGRGSGVSDRSLYEDTAFVYALHKDGFIDNRTRNTYTRLVPLVTANLRKPDLIIWLRVSPEEAMARIKARGRECEKNISLRYLQILDSCYNQMFGELERLGHTIIQLDWSGDEKGNHLLLMNLLRSRFSRGTTVALPREVEEEIAVPVTC